MSPASTSAKLAAVACVTATPSASVRSAMVPTAVGTSFTALTVMATVTKADGVLFESRTR